MTTDIAPAARALTLFNESGDVTIAWTEEQDAVMEAIIAKKMKEGITFFIIQPRLGGWLPPKKTELRDAAEAAKHRALSIADEDLTKFVESGAGEAIPTPRASAGGTRVSRNPSEVARSESVGVRQRQGG